MSWPLILNVGSGIRIFLIKSCAFSEILLGITYYADLILANKAEYDESEESKGNLPVSRA